VAGHVPGGDRDPSEVSDVARHAAASVPLAAHEFLLGLAVDATGSGSAGLMALLHRCRDYFSVEAASVWRAADRDRFRLTAAALSDGSGFTEPISVLTDDETVDRLLQEGQLVVSQDDLRTTFTYDFTGDPYALVVPLGEGSEFTGALSLLTTSERVWSADEVAIVKLVARLIGPISARLRLEVESTRRLGLLEMVNRVSAQAATANSDSVAEARSRILDLTREHFGADDVAVWNLDSGGFALTEGSGVAGARFGTRVSATDTQIEFLWRSRFTFTHVGSLTPERALPFDERTVAMLVAVGDSESIEGVLSFIRIGGRRWTNGEVSAAQSVARLIRQMTIRVDAEREVRRRLALESLVSAVAADFVDVTPDSVDSKLDSTLAALIDFFGLEQASVWRFEGTRVVCRMARNVEGRDEIEGNSGVLPDFERLESQGWANVPLGVLADAVGVAGFCESDHRALVTAYRGATGLLGALVMIRPERRHWSDDEITAALSISDVFGFSRVRLLGMRQQIRRQQTDEVLIDVSGRLLEINADDSESVIVDVLERLRDHLGLVSVALWETDQAHQDVGCRYEARSSNGPILGGLAPMAVGDPMLRPLVESSGVIDWNVADPTGQAQGGIDLVALKILVSDDDLVFLTALGEGSEAIDNDTIAALQSTAGIFAQLHRRFAAEKMAELLRRSERVINSILLRFIDTSVGAQQDPLTDAIAEVGELMAVASLGLWEIDDEAAVVRRTKVWKRDQAFQFPGDSVEIISLDHSDFVEIKRFGKAARVHFDGVDDDWIVLGAPLMVGTDVVGGLVANFGPITIPESKLAVLMGVLDSFAALIAQLRTRSTAEGTLLRKLEADVRLRDLARRLVKASSDDSSATDEAFRMLCGPAQVDHASLWRATIAAGTAGISLVTETHGPELSAIPEELTSTLLSTDDVAGMPIPNGRVGQWNAPSAPGTVPAIFSAIASDDDRRVATFGQSVDETHAVYLLVSRPGNREFDSEEVDFFKSAASMLAEHDNRVTAERWFSAGIDLAPIAISMRDSAMRLISCNPAYERLVGRSLEELRGSDLHDVLDMPDAKFHMTRQEDLPEAEHLSEEVRYVRPDGSVSWGRINSAPVHLPGRREPFRITYIEDTTTSRRRRELLEWQATHDELTGLPNRRLFLRMANKRLEESRDHAMLVLDLDRFKVVNDSLGHSVGDQLLITCADRIRLSLRPGDVVCRLGGDEFAILLTSPADLATASAVADRLLSLLREPARIADVNVFPSASIGIAVPEETDRVDDLLRHADAAMYQSKAAGRDRCTGFDSSMREAVLDRIRTETDLRLAIDNGQLEVHYQPEVMLASGEIVGAEALVRWRHPEWGLLTAGSFINVAEESGIVVDLGRWVLGVATKQAAHWLSQGHDIIIRVNLSGRQVRHAVVAEVEEALQTAGLAPDRLCLELTETAIMDDIDESEQILARLHDLGVKLAIDDFGTGFSSLAYLKRLPVDILKIDRSFVDGVGVDPDDTAIVESVIGLAKTLNLDVVAEGIEDRTQVQELLRLGCDRGQGFHLARPAPADEVELLLERSRLF